MLTVKARPRTQYSPIRHLAWAVWLNHDPVRCWMPAYAAYYDASGTEHDGTSPLFVVGLAATEARWLAFEREWNRKLRYLQLPYFHAKEYAHFKGPFERLKEADPDKRMEALGVLLHVIKRHIAKAFIVQLSQSVFDAADADYHLNDVFRSPYPLAAGSCVARVKAWMAAKHPASPMHHVFEKGDSGQGPFIETLEREGIAGITTNPKKDAQGEWFRPFEAADLVAYECAVAIRRNLQGVKRGPRYPVKLIVSHIPQEYYVHTVESIKAECEKYPTAFPRREGR